MEANLSIGDFSRMTFVSVKALRHYDEIGLLPPSWVDPRSGYRHYSVAQVPVAQAIRRLRDLGMPLEDIGTVVHASDVGARNAAIAAHLGRMEDHLEETRATVASRPTSPRPRRAEVGASGFHPRREQMNQSGVLPRSRPRDGARP